MTVIHVGNIGETFNPTQLVGKNLRATVNINVRKWAGIDPKNVLYVAKAGDDIGNVYSYLYGKGVDADKLWWMLGSDSTRPIRYVLHNANAFHFGNLKDQGAKTTKEEAEEQKKKDEENNGNWWDKLGLNSDLLKKGAYVVGGVLLAKWIIVDGLFKSKNK